MEIVVHRRPRHDRLFGSSWGFDTLWHDVAYGVRVLLKSPSFTAVLVLTLAVGIGAATAAFGVINAVLLRPLPVRDQERLVILSAEDRTRADSHIGIPSSGVHALAETGRAFAGVAAVRREGAQPFAARYRDRLLSVAAAFVGGDFFRVLGTAPAAGRLLAPEDDAPGALPSVVLSYHTWQRDFGGDPAIIGQPLQLINGPQTVVGVAPEGFEYPMGTEVWASMAPIERMFPSAPGPDAGFPSDIVARLRPGVTVAQAHAEFAAYLMRYPSRSLGDATSRTARVQLFSERVVGNLRPTLLILSTAVALVLIMALINAAGLLVTRGVARRPELSLRAALGAGQGRLVRQLLTESVVLAGAAGLVGVAGAAALLRAAARLAPPELVRFDEIRLDGAVLAFALVLTLGTVLLFGLAPALGTVRRNLESTLRGGSHAVAGRRHGEYSRRLIVAGQVALAVIVLTTAGLLGRSLDRLQRMDLGFEPEPLLVVGLEDMTPFDAHTDSWAVAEARYHAVLDALAVRLPNEQGITGVTTMFVRPFSGSSFDVTYAVDGADPGEVPGRPRVALEPGLEAHFMTLGIPLRRGRDFTTADRTGAPPVAVVSEAFARQTWPGRNPIGQRVRITPEDSTQPWRTVIGVAGDTRSRDVTTPPEPTVYVPLRQTASAPMFVALRTVDADPLRAVAVLKGVLRDADPAFGIREIDRGGDLLAARLARTRFLAAVLAALSSAAVALSGIGVYGLLAAAVRERRHEIGIRMALGATPAEVRTLVVHQAILVVGLGFATGMALALIGTRLLRTALYGVSPADPATLAAVLLTLLVVAVVAAYAPAVRATRVDPLVALRSE
jgi:predicted permease